MALLFLSGPHIFLLLYIQRREKKRMKEGEGERQRDYRKDFNYFTYLTHEIIITGYFPWIIMLP